MRERNYDFAMFVFLVSMEENQFVDGGAEQLAVVVNVSLVKS